MRKHLYLITEHEDDSKVGNVEFSEHRHEAITKNDQGPVQLRDLNTNEVTLYQAVGLGYHDFEDQADYEDRAIAVAREKMQEIDEQWIEKAGVSDFLEAPA